MRLATSVRTSLGIACSVAAMSSQAATMTLTDWKFASGNIVNAGAPNYNGEAGGFKGTLTGAGPGFDTNSLYTYCVQLTNYFYWSTPNAVNVTLASDYFANNPVFGAGSGVGNTKAALLGKLFSYVEADPTRVDTSAESTALQLAVWNIVYDTDLTLGSGTFKDTSSYAAAANGFLSAASSYAGPLTQAVYVLDGAMQDQLIWRRIPEPTSAALVAVALFGLSFTRRRRA